MAKPKPRDSGLELIDAYERATVRTRMEHLSTGGHTADVIAQERADIEALAARIADAMRADYLMNARRPS